MPHWVQLLKNNIFIVHMRYVFLLGIFILSLLSIPHTSIAASSFQPAFKTLGIWDADAEMRVDVNVWYPTYSRPSPASYAPWTLNVVRYGRSAKGRFPLIILSHDTTATRFSYHETAAILAQSGFVVVAPAHKNDNVNHIPYPFSLRQLTERATELHFALDVALNHKDVRDSVDPERIGILGFGMGASAAFVLGGAKPTGTGWKEYCKNADSKTLYCEPWVSKRIQELVEALPLKKDYSKNNIKAIAAVAPSLSMLFAKDSLQGVASQILLVEAAQDGLNLAPWNTKSLLKNFPQKPNFVRIENVDTADLMSACPPQLRLNIPELCGQVSAPLRIEAHKELNFALTQFFLSTLGLIQPTK